MSIWRDKRVVEALRVMVRDGLSARQIADNLSIGRPDWMRITRSAVIGRCHRMGLKLQGKPGCPEKDNAA